jgi:excisionase family DNA binding protein
MPLHATQYSTPQASSFTSLLTRQDVARSLSTCLRTIDEAIASGDIEIVRIGRSVRIRPSALEEFIEARITRRNPRRQAQKVSSLKGDAQ